MRILFLTHRLPYAANRGDRLRGLHLLKHLSRDADVDVISLVHSREEAGHAGDLRGVAASVAVAPVSRARSYLRAAIATLRGGPLTHALLDAPSMLRLIRQ